MSYQLLINNSPILSGSIVTGAVIIVLLLIILAVIIDAFWRRIRDSETMRYEFITIIAHKFRTPLTSIKWILENMSTNETDPLKKESLSGIKASNEKLIALTGTLVELTDSANEKRSAYVWEKVNFCDFTRSVAETYKDTFHEKNIFFSVKCDDPEVLVTVDRSRMEFVLQTLFENACNYTSPGKNVDAIVERKGHHAVFSVTDHGIGIAKEDMPKVFSKFFRAENARQADTEGLGVGLFLARSIMTRHHGRIAVYSDGIDKGSTFMLTLPRVRK
jgi:signal transduction histidine kinase